ncbi:Dynamitin-domain-containing protein [Flagelloscypha sp. PMI_526]|nr:Dynamitin-domain-containing protein [Flagelloscypha sp. PMI_526]
MSSKYANLPDIDTAQDVYETEDVFPSSHLNKGDSSDDDMPPTNNDAATREELDHANLISAEAASKLFRKAERKRTDDDASNSDPESPTKSKRPVPLAQRLRMLQAELSSLEADCSDPKTGVDPGELILGLVDIRGRLEKIKKGREGRGKLVGVLTSDADEGANTVTPMVNGNAKHDDIKAEKPAPVRNLVEMDKRVGELEKLVGSSSTTLDETTPLPTPLLPLITRLNMQINLLTQPRHIDSISRRLKLLLSDLERASQHARHGKHGNASSPNQASIDQNIQTLLPLLNRLTPLLPHIPHILTRLRTLSALHTSASGFTQTLSGLEEEQRKTRESLKILEAAVERVEASVKENSGVVSQNVKGLDKKVEQAH